MLARPGLRAAAASVGLVAVFVASAFGHTSSPNGDRPHRSRGILMPLLSTRLRRSLVRTGDNPAHGHQSRTSLRRLHSAAGCEMKRARASKITDDNPEGVLSPPRGLEPRTVGLKVVEHMFHAVSRRAILSSNRSIRSLESP